MQELGEVVDVLLTRLGEALQDAQTRRVGKAEEMIRQLVPRVLEKYKGYFMFEYT